MPGSPLIPRVYFGKSSYKALVDSGSDISIISNAVFRKIPKKFILSSSKANLSPLTSASGHSISPIARAQVRLSIANIPCVVTFVVIQNFRFGLLLGSDFLYDQKHGN